MTPGQQQIFNMQMAGWRKELEHFARLVSSASSKPCAIVLLTSDDTTDTPELICDALGLLCDAWTDLTVEILNPSVKVADHD